MPGVQLQRGVWSIVRKTLPALKASVLRDFEEILTHHELFDKVAVNKTELTYSFMGRTVEFFSVDNQQKVRSRKRDVLEISEANEVLYDDFRQLILRTAYRVYLDFNPDDINTWIKTELEDKRQHTAGDVEVIVSSYKDNTFLSPELIREIELLQGTDPEYWKIFGLGEYGVITGLIFPKINIVPSVPKDATLVACGLDWGFQADPTACNEVWKHSGELYINELIYETGLTNNDIDAKLSILGVSKRTEIIADSAEPKSIEELYRLGWNIKGAKKGPDSIRAGLDILRRYKLNVTAKSLGFLKEQKAYKWATDKNGNQLNVPIDRQNHCFTGSTLIETSEGLKPIKDIVAGDLVLTRAGYKKVNKLWINGHAEVFGFKLKCGIFSLQIECTADHHFLTNSGWKQINQISKADTIYLSSNLTEGSTIYTMEKGISQKVSDGSTVLFGNTLTAKCRKAFMFTTLTKIPTTTIYQTLNSGKDLNTCRFTPKSRTRMSYAGVLTTQEHLQTNGTRVRQEESGIVSMQLTTASGILTTPKSRVISAGSPLNQQTHTPVFAADTAKQKTEHSREWTTKKEYAEDAAQSLPLTAISEKSFAVPVALMQISVMYAAKEEIYDIEVDGQHEYFANGMLVHNSADSIRYVALERLSFQNTEFIVV